MAARSRAVAFAEVERLFTQVQPVLQRYPNVVSVGVGIRKRKGKRTGEPCFVVGVSKKSDSSKRPLPKSILGVRIDVQVARAPRLLASLGAGGECRTQGRAERGQIGMLARSGGEHFALTALHVLLTERVSIDVASSPFKDANVEARDLGDEFGVIGQLVKGSFGTHEDIACIRLNASVTPSGLLGGTQTRLQAPEPISLDLLGKSVRLVVPGDARVSGTLVEWPVSGPFDTASGPAVFHSLAKFELDAQHVRKGWSGSAIFTRQARPLALLSFGSNASRDGSVPAYGYGFPLAPHWDAWALSTLSES